MNEKSISVIRAEFKAASFDELPDLISAYEADERLQVRDITDKARRRIEAFEKEKQRIEKMKEYEKMYSDYEFICGIDEVGRGPLAGPVVTGAVILPKDCDILYLNDSKQLSEKKEKSYMKR